MLTIELNIKFLSPVFAFWRPIRVSFIAESGNSNVICNSREIKRRDTQGTESISLITATKNFNIENDNIFNEENYCFKGKMNVWPVGLFIYFSDLQVSCFLTECHLSENMELRDPCWRRWIPAQQWPVIALSTPIQLKPYTLRRETTDIRLPRLTTI